MRPRASFVPTTACWLTSATTSTPAAAIRGPPMPLRVIPGQTCRRASDRVAPCRSPEASPAESTMTGSAVAVNADDRDADRVGLPDQIIAVDQKHAATLDGEGGGAT